jgi:hypothetical protein
MKRTILTAAVLLLPAALFAEVHININAGVAVSQNIPDDEAWFEGDRYSNNSEMSFEYNWNLDKGRRVLQYRQVSFFPVNGTWAFGPWLVRGGVCHSSCHLHHAHNFYHHSGVAPQWRREYSHRDQYNRPQYRYECRDEHYTRRAPVVVTRHEYNPPVRHEYTPPVRHEYNSQPEKHYERTAETPRITEERRQILEERNHIEQSRNSNNQNRDNDNYEYKNDHRNENQPLVQVTERERVR